MMLCRQLFCCHRGPGGKQRRGDARNQKTYSQYHGGGRRDHCDGDGGGQPEDGGGRNRYHRAHEDIGKVVDG